MTDTETTTAIETVTGWHFSTGRLRDGREIVPGRWEVHEGPLVLCESGYHLSERPLDALRYSPGPFVGRVEGRGEMLRDADKIACRERRYIESPRDVSRLLRRFARACALDVIHLWTPPDVVTRWLWTGDEALRIAASTAAARAADAAYVYAAAYAADAAASAAAASRAIAASLGAAQNARLLAWLIGPDLPDVIAPEEIAARKEKPHAG